MRLPEVYTCRYLAERVLSSGVVVPVGISPKPPIVTFDYELACMAKILQPPWDVTGWYWKTYSPRYWRLLDYYGPERIARELISISEEHGGRPLALLCYEDLTKPHRCHRVVLSTWWYEATGWELPELTDDGELLALHQLHRQTMPILPKDEER